MELRSVHTPRTFATRPYRELTINCTFVYQRSRTLEYFNLMKLIIEFKACGVYKVNASIIVFQFNQLEVKATREKRNY